MLKKSLLIVACIAMFVGGLRAEDMSGYYEKFRSSIVRVYNGSGHGTGFIINNDGYILTNAHVTALIRKYVDKEENIRTTKLTDSEADNMVKDKRRYYIVMQNVGGEIYAYRAELVAERRALDLALIKVSNLKECRPMRLSESEPKVGEQVATIGFSGANDDEEKWDKCVSFLGIPNITDESINKFVEKRIDEALKNLPNGEREAARDICLKMIGKEPLTAEESELAKKAGLEAIVERILKKTVVAEENTMAVGGFNKTTASCPEITKLPEEFNDIANPACGNFGSIEKLATVEYWGLDWNSRAKVIQHNAVQRRGNSGGPLFNKDGLVVGVVTAGFNNKEDVHMMLASEISEAIRFLKDKGVEYNTSAPDVPAAVAENLPKEAALVKVAFDNGSTSVVKDGVFTSADGKLLVRFDGNLAYRNAYAIYKIGDTAFSRAVKLVQKFADGKLALFEVIDAKNAKFPFLGKSDTALKKSRDFSILKSTADIQKLARGFDYRKNSSKKLEEPEAKCFSSKDVPSRIEDSGKFGKTTVFIADGEKSDGGAVVDSNGKLAGVVIGADKNGKNIIVPASAFEAAFASREKQAQPEAVDTSWRSKFFVGDVVVFVLIVAGGALLCVAIFLVSRRRRNVSGAGLQNFEPAQEAEAENGAYVPKQLLSYGAEDLKSKPISVRSVVMKIEDILADKISTDNVGLYKIAREYKMLQSKAVARLDKCLALADMGKRREALMMMSAYPSLINIINELQFPQLEKWTIYCARAGAPVPDRIPNERIDKVNDLISEMRNAPEDHSQQLRKYMAANEFEKAIELLEMDLAVAPDDPVIMRRLLAVKNNFLDAQITKISALAQRGMHAEAVELFDSFQAGIPQELKDASARWGKMFAYIRSQKFAAAAAEMEELKAALEASTAEDWRNIFTILSAIDGYVEAFPELGETLDSAAVAQKRALAEECKREYETRAAFEESCGELDKCVGALRSLFEHGKVSREMLVDNLAVLERAWNAVADFGRDIPDDVSARYKKGANFVRNEIRRIDRIRKATAFGISAVVVLTAGAIGVKCYLDKLRNAAYAEYNALYNKHAAAKVLEETSASLDARHIKYAKIPQFAEIKAKIAEKIDAEKRREADLKVFVKNCGEPIELKPQSDAVYARETALKTEFARLAGTLPESFAEELNGAKSTFDISLKKYRAYIEGVITSKRAKILGEVRALYAGLKDGFERGELDAEAVKKVCDGIADFEKSTDKYVKKPSKSDTEEIGKYRDGVENMQRVRKDTDAALAELSESRNFSSYSGAVKKINRLCENNMPDYNVYQALNGGEERAKTLKEFCEQLYASRSGMFSLLRSGLEKYFRKNKSRHVAGVKGEADGGSDFQSFVFGENSEAGLIGKIKELCPENDLKMYSYKREWYTENSGYKPWKTDVVYTVGEVKEHILPLKDIGGKFRGCDVLEASKTVYSYVVVSETSAFRKNPVPVAKTFEHIIYADSTGQVDFGRGAKLSDGVLSPESKILEKIRSGSLSITVDRMNNTRAEISPDVSFLGLLGDIVYDGEIRENFKFYALGKMLDALNQFAPYGSGYWFSPTAVRLNRLFQKDNKSFLSRGSWAFGETENRMKSLELFPTRSLEERIEFLTANKISFVDEAKLTSRCVEKMRNPTVEIVGVFDVDGRLPASLKLERDRLYISLDSRGKTVCASASEFKSVRGLALAPIVQMYTPRGMVADVAQAQELDSAALVDSVCNYLFEFNPQNKLERKTLDKNVAVSKKLGTITIPQLNIPEPGIPLSKALRSIAALSRQHDSAGGANVKGVEIEFKSDWDIPITFRAENWNVGRILAFICNKYDFSMKITKGKIVIEKKSLRYEN